MRLTGNDRCKLVHNLTTNEVNKLPDQAVSETFFPDSRGRILFYARLAKLSDQLFLDVDPNMEDALLKHLDRYIIREDVQLADETDSTCQFALLGEKAEDLLAGWLGETIRSMPDSSLLMVEASGTPIMLRRQPWGQASLWEVIVPVTAGDSVWAEISGRLPSEHGSPLSWEIFELTRIDAGIPSYPTDISDANFPQEVDRIEQSISFTKGCYLGQETVARIDAFGHVNRVMRGIEWQGHQPVPLPLDVKFGNRLAGTVTSAAWHPEQKKWHGLALLRGIDKPDTASASVISGDSSLDATMVTLPFKN